MQYSNVGSVKNKRFLNMEGISSKFIQHFVQILCFFIPFLSCLIWSQSIEAQYVGGLQWSLYQKTLNPASVLNANNIFASSSPSSGGITNTLASQPNYMSSGTYCSGSVPWINSFQTTCFTNIGLFGMTLNNPYGMMMQFTGYFLPSVSGTYVFSSYSDDWINAWIGSAAKVPGVSNTDSNLAFSSSCCSVTVSSTPIYLTAGVYYPFLMHYCNTGGSSGMQVAWSLPGAPSTFIVDGTGYFFTEPPILTSGLQWQLYQVPTVLTVPSVATMITYFISNSAGSSGVSTTLTSQPSYISTGVYCSQSAPWATAYSTTCFTNIGLFGMSITSPYQNIYMQFSGYFLPPVTGSYIFSSYSDDWLYAWIGSAAQAPGASNSDSNTAFRNTCCSVVNHPAITLTAGVYYPFLIYYGQGASSNGLQLAWSLPSNPTNFIVDGTRYFFSSSKCTKWGYNAPGCGKSAIGGDTGSPVGQGGNGWKWSA